jgi:hypothetical protein
MPFPEAQDTLVIGDQRTAELDRGCDQKSICRIAVLEVVELITPRGLTMAKRRRFDPGTLQESRDPFFNRKIELDAPGVDKECDLPKGDGAEANGSAILPATIDPSARPWAQALIAAVEPESDMRVEQQRIRHRSVSRPVPASGATSRAGAIRSMPSRTRTDPG